MKVIGYFEIYGFKGFFVELVCDDKEIICFNILEVKVNLFDY